jgi:multiple sugar transport system substrate-binding protein
VLDQATFPAVARAGLLRDLNPLLRGEAWSRTEAFWPTALRAGLFRGQQLALPLQLALDLLLYSPQTFAAGGQPAPAAGWGWDQLLTAARALTRPAAPGEQPRWGFLASSTAPHLIGLAWQHGATVVDDAGRLVLTEPGTIEALELLASLVGRLGVAPPLDRTVRPSGVSPRSEVGSGYAAMTVARVTGPVHWWRLGGNARLEIAPLPRAREAVSYGTAALMLGVAAGAPSPERAARALRALSDAGPDTLWPPARRAGVDLRRANTQMSEQDEASLLGALADLRVAPGGLTPELLAIVRDHVVAPVLAGELGAAAAARRGQALVDRLTA